ncbi:MAG: SdpI family protein [Chitinophagaceae bacterium]
MKRITFFEGCIILLWLLPFLYLIAAFPLFATSLPMHYDSNGQPDRFGSRDEFILVVFVLQLVAASIFLLIKFLPRIDPKRKARYSQNTFRKLSLALLLFITFINLLFIYSAIHVEFKVTRFLYPLIGLLLAYIGNLMNSIKPNYFVGIRTPWTLESEETWRKTHQLASKIWLPGGILITFITLFLSAKSSSIFFAVMVVIMSLIPVVYSYVFFKKHQTNLP